MAMYYDINGNPINLTSGVISPILAENQLIAHKGGNGGTANTIANFELGIANGYKILEADVRFTSDSVPVLSHDATINGYTIANYTYNALVALVPTLARLDDFLILCKNNNVVAELDFTKEYSTTQTNICYNTIKKLGMLGRTFFTVYDTTARTLMSLDSDIIICVSGVNSTYGVDNISDIIAGVRLCICSTTYESVTKYLVEYMHTAGCLSKPWTVNSTSEINTLFGYGCDYIITDSVKPSDI